MNEQDLENLVSEEHLKERGFHKRHKTMYRVIHKQEVRFIEIMPNAYMLDGFYYVERKSEKYEEEMT